MPGTGGPSASKDLVLGWRVGPYMDPLKGNAKAGSQTSADLVTVAAREIANHTAIIAQSGSGKSSFLGRLVEEIMLMTKSRCLIIDPNSDFRLVSDAEDDELWDKAKYLLDARRGKLPHEAAKQDFSERWSRLQKRILTGPNVAASYDSQPVKVLWTNVDSNFLAAGVETPFRIGIYHCHEFVKAIDILLYYTGEQLNAVDEAHKIWQNYKTETSAVFRGFLKKYFSHEKYKKRRRGSMHNCQVRKRRIPPREYAAGGSGSRNKKQPKSLWVEPWIVAPPPCPS